MVHLEQFAKARYDIITPVRNSFFITTVPGLEQFAKAKYDIITARHITSLVPVYQSTPEHLRLEENRS